MDKFSEFFINDQCFIGDRMIGMAVSMFALAMFCLSTLMIVKMLENNEGKRGGK